MNHSPSFHSSDGDLSPGQAPAAHLTDELSQLVWVQGLAARLCANYSADVGLGEDVSQEVLIASLQSGPKQPGERRAWLAGALRRRLKMARRSRGRRAAHEADAAEAFAQRSEGPADPSAVLERFDTHREVAEAVGQLREPYRSTLLLRYFEDRTPTEIAREEGVPIGTVKTRLTRGLRELKEDLEKRLGGSQGSIGLYGALLPLAQRYVERVGAATPGLGTQPVQADTVRHWATSKLTGLGVGVACSAALVWGVVTLHGASGSDGAGKPSASAVNGPGLIEESSVGSEATAFQAASDADPSRSKLNLTPPAREEASAKGVTDSSSNLTVRLRVRAVDPLGAPISGAMLTRHASRGRSDEAPIELGRTDATGTLSVEVPLEVGRVQLQAPGLTTAMAGSIASVGAQQSTLVMAAQSLTVEGVVLGLDGRPVEDAQVRYRARIDLRKLQEDVLPSATQPSWVTRTDGAGTFRLEDVPQLPGAVLIADAGAAGAVEQPLQGGEGSYQELVLREDSGEVRGRVVLPDGSPVAGADVALEGGSTTSDASGRFTLPAPRAEATLRAVHPDFGLGEWPYRAQESPDSAIEVVLTRRPTVLRGRVVDAIGQPVANAVVRTLNQTPFGVTGRAAGALTQSSVLMSAEGKLRRTTDGRSNAAGLFTLTLLSDRTYDVVAMDSSSLQYVLAEDVDSGAGSLTLTIEAAEPSAASLPITGRVVSFDGEPIAGASVQVHLVLGDRDRSGLTSYESMFAGRQAVLQGPTLTTGSSGGFSFSGITMGPGVQLTADAGERYGVLTLTPDAKEPTTFRLPTLTRLRVRVSPERASASFQFALLQPETGEPSHLYLKQDTATFSILSGEVEGAQSPVYRAAIGEYDLVLLRGNKELERRRVHLPLSDTVLSIDL